MKRYYLKIFILILSPLLLILNSCKEDVLAPANINYALPEIKQISVITPIIKTGEPTVVSVTAEQGSSFQWSCDAGSFSSPTTNQTTWTAGDQGGTFTLKCIVSNSSGSRIATAPVKVIKIIVPTGVIAYWPFEGDLKDYAGNATMQPNSAISADYDDAAVGYGSALFQGEIGDISGALYPTGGANLKMGPSDDFSISFWMKTTSEENGFVFGRTLNGVTNKGVYLSGGQIRFNVGTKRTRADMAVNDDTWHHVIMVKTGIAVTIYIDGNDETSANSITSFSSDGSSVLTFGASTLGNYLGRIDDLQFYQKALTTGELDALFGR